MKYMGKIVRAILLVVIGIAILSHIHGIVERSYSAANRDAAIATVNGGNHEFAAQQVVKSGGQGLNELIGFGYACIILLGGISITRNVISWRKEYISAERTSTN